MVGGRFAFARGVERDREIEARLMIGGIGRDFRLEIGHRADRFRLFGDIDGGLRRGDGRVAPLGLGNERQCFLGLIDRAGADITARKTGKRRDIGIVGRQELRIEIGGGREIIRGQRLVGGFQQILFLAADAAPSAAVREMP